MLETNEIEKTEPIPAKRRKRPLFIALLCVLLCVLAAGGITAYVLVSDYYANYYINSIEISARKHVLVVGDTDKLAFTIAPENPKVNDLTFESSAPDIVLVYGDGNIVAKGPGTADIRAYSSGGEVECSIKFIVEQPAEELRNVPDSLTLTLGKSKDIAVEVLPADATDILRFESGNEDIATVDASGSVYGRGVGKTAITVKCGRLEKQISIEVYIPVEDIYVFEDKIVLDVGKSQRIIAAIYPENATYNGMVFTTTNGSVITLGTDGLVTATSELNGGADRAATVYVRDEQNRVSKSIKVIVRNPYSYEWDEKYSSINGWNTYARVFANTVPNCTGFTLTYKLTSPNKTPDISSKMTNSDYYVYVYTDANKWVKVGTFRVGEKDRLVTAEISFEAMNIKKVACVNSKKTVGASGYYNDVTEIKSLIYD